MRYLFLLGLLVILAGCGDSNSTTNVNVTSGAGGSVNPPTVDCTNPANADNPACQKK